MRVPAAAIGLALALLLGGCARHRLDAPARTAAGTPAATTPITSANPAQPPTAGLTPTAFEQAASNPAAPSASAPNPVDLARADPTPRDLSPAERAAILALGPWPPAPRRDPGNRHSDGQGGAADAVALGRRLFFDTGLSADGRVACASCHRPERAFTDGLAQSLGPHGRLDRHAPSLWNAGLQRWQGWDGAADSLWSQALRPLLDPREMGSSAARVRAHLRGDGDLACRLRRVTGRRVDDFADEALLVETGKAIGAFVATLVSGRTPFDDFRDAMAQPGATPADALAATGYPPEALAGLRLFVGRGRCVLCHMGPLFSNGEFADIGLPFFVRPGVVDPGRQGGIVALRASRHTLLSPWADPAPSGASVTLDGEALPTRHLILRHSAFGEFKVPSLRNVALTAPYMHRGQLADLDAVVRHYSELDLERLHADGERLLEPLHLSDTEIAALRAFLQTLSDPGATRWRAPAEPPCR